MEMMFGASSLHCKVLALISRADAELLRSHRNSADGLWAELQLMMRRFRGDPPQAQREVE